MTKVNPLKENAKMTKAKFTKGPWHVGMRSGHNASIIYEYDGKDAHHDSAICSVYGISLNRDIEQSKDDDGMKNARVIAAAPEMLYALELVKQSSEWSCMESDTQDAVLAALAKANPT
jgi:hypothetical protein